MMAWLNTVHPDRIDPMDSDSSTGAGRRELTQKELADLWDARCCLESVAVRLACDHVEESDLRELRQLASQRAEAAVRNDDRAAHHHDLEFHRLLIRLSGNGVLGDLAINLPLLEESDIDETAGNVHRVRDAHTKIINALKARDADTAEQLVRQLLENKKQRDLDALAHRFHL